MRGSLALLLVAACGESEPTSGLDASIADATNMDASISGTVEVEVGTGATAFEPIQEGQRLDLTMAPQTGGGVPGFHFNAAVRTKGLEPSGAIVHFTVTRERDGAAISDVMQQVNLIEDGDHHIGYGFRAIVSACGDVSDEALLFTVDVLDAQGANGEDTQRFLGPMFCPR